jgi:hypothetical protein
VYRKEDLLAEAAPGTASRLAVIAEHIASSFRQLITQYSSVDGINTSDRSAFVVGLYDGMMNTPRDQGQSLPRRPGYNRKVRANKSIPTVAAHVHVHPYTLAFGLGRQIRFSVPLDEITAELENQTQQRLPSKCSEQGE